MTLVETSPDPVRARVAGRARAWLGAAIAVLLVGTYLTVWTTYAQLHVPPLRYDQLPAGAVATSQGADYRLVRLRQTTRFGNGFDGPASPSPDAVWLVADLTVTRQVREKYFSCTLSAISTDGRSWDTSSASVIHDGESCAPDDAVLGRAYPVVVYFEVPVVDVDKIVGLALPSYGWRPEQVLTPPA